MTRCIRFGPFVRQQGDLMISSFLAKVTTKPLRACRRKDGKQRGPCLHNLSTSRVTFCCWLKWPHYHHSRHILSKMESNLTSAFLTNERKAFRDDSESVSLKILDLLTFWASGFFDTVLVPTIQSVVLTLLTIWIGFIPNHVFLRNPLQINCCFAFANGSHTEW